MSILGSLPNFIENQSPPKTSSKSTRTYENKTFSVSEFLTTPKKQTLANTNFSGKWNEIINVENRPEGYTYVSDHKDIENILRANSAAATKRLNNKRPVTHSVFIEKYTPTSRISCKRDPKETQIALQKSVKMQEKIRNELL